MTNEQMTAGRFLRWYKARCRISWIKAQLATGEKVVVRTMTKATVYRACHAETFKATRTGAYVQRGKAWDCIDFCDLYIA